MFKSVGLGTIQGMQADFCIIDEFPIPVPMPCEPVLPWKAAVKKKLECCKQEQEKEDTMNYNEIEASRRYLTGRVNDVGYTIREALNVQFNLDKKERPQSYAELIAAIKNDQYTLDAKMTAKIDAVVAQDGYYYGSMLDGIKWKLPNQPDYDGYNTAEKAMVKAQTAARDVIQTGTPADGLKALQDFEAWTYTPPVASSTSVN